MSAAQPVVGLATCAALPGLSPDDRLLLAALRTRGVAAEPIIWEERYTEWERLRLYVVRSTWDYAYRYRQFLAWTRAMASVSSILNPAEILGWNAHKSYLADLEARGVAVVPTCFIKPSAPRDLADLLGERGWQDAVLKPAIGASGRWLLRFRAEQAAEVSGRARRLLNHEDVLLQPFLPSVLERGELSVVFVDGVATHAVRKRPARGEVCVHEEYGGTVEPAEPSAQEAELAEAAMRAVEGELLYGRVDLIEDPDGRPLVSELELIEPELLFRFSDQALQRMVEAIARRLEG